MLEGPGVAVQQKLQTLPGVAANEDPPAVAQHHHEQVHPHSLLAQPHPRRSPIHLRLLAWVGLESHRRPLIPHRLLPPRTKVAHHRRIRACVALVRQLSMHNRGVEAHLRSPTAKKALPVIQTPLLAHATLLGPRLPQPLAHRLDVQSQLPCNRLPAQTSFPQPAYRFPSAFLDQRHLRGTFRRHGKHLPSALLVHPYLLWLGGGGDF